MTKSNPAKVTKNTHNVPRKQWKKWTLVGQSVFNMLYSHMTLSQEAYIHPLSQMIPQEHFKTTAWNAAWMAADICSRGEKHYIKELMKELGV